jgi:hypothetical protein
MSETQFEAISYVWGSSDRDQDILCDGNVMKITPNLSRVLRRIRLPKTPRRLWADSICINQDDWEEKGHQVNIMGEIYRTAERVLIYVGPDEGGHAPQLCSLLNDANQMIDDTCKKIDMSWGSFPWPDEDDPILDDPRWESMYHLLRQDWFRRGWVVREAAFARYGEVIWGRSEFSWDHFMRTYTWLFRRAPRPLYSANIVRLEKKPHFEAYRMRETSFVQIFYAEYDWYTQSLLDVLADAKTLQLTDHRDRIYAFMELTADRKHQLSLYPDYKSSHLDLYRRFTTQYIHSLKNVDVLGHVTHMPSSTDFDIPSWIPRWDIELSSISPTFVSTGVELQARDMSVYEPTVIDGTILKVRGVVWDEIQFVSNIFEEATLTIRVIRELWETIREMTVVSPYEMSSRLSAFLVVLCAGLYNREWSQWNRDRTAFVSKAQLEHETRDSSMSSCSSSATGGGDPTIYLNLATEILNGRKLMVTKRGYMGLAPSITEKEDLCGIIFGCSTPCILRKTSQDQSYNFLGATYVPGRQPREAEAGGIGFDILGEEYSKDWVDWDIEEQDIYLV